jgi:hypothetical protein
MARFITTIQLHNAAETDYEKLNAELVKQSFRGIREVNKQKGDAPEQIKYSREGNVTLQEVTDAVLKAAEKTGKKYSFTIIRNKPVYN